MLFVGINKDSKNGIFDRQYPPLARAGIFTKASAGFKPVPTRIIKHCKSTNYNPKKVVVFFCKKSKLCYRNGYGIEKDELKGIYWLQKAADLGDQKATIELTEAVPENATPSQTETQSAAIVEVENATVEPPKKLQKVKQKIEKGDISGEYTGTLLRYDWSGQNLISQTPINVSLDQKKKNISGIWTEKEGDSIAFTAVIEDKMIVFENSRIDRIEHFSKDNPRQYVFRDAKLQVIENGEEVYIVGNLQLYDINEHENEKPMYLILKRHTDDSISATAGIVSKMVVYPNPVTNNSFKLSFVLKEQTPISIKIYDLTGLPPAGPSRNIYKG